jgi:hypothetical protein
MGGPAVDRSHRARWWRIAARTSRTTVLSCAVLVALFGAAMSSPVVTLVWAPAVGILSAAAAAVTADGAAARRAAWIAGTGAAAAVPFLSGLGLLGPGAAFLVPLLVILGALWMVESAAGAPGDVAAARHELAVLRRAAPELPVDGLVRAWRDTTDRLRPGVHPVVAAVTAEARSLIVDELTRRDPVGVDRWLREGGDPGEHLSGEAGCSA